MAKRGRPTDYSQALASLICERLAEGESLREIIRSDENLPRLSTIFQWLSIHSEFADQYARAREAQAEALVDEAREIADDATNDWMEKLGKDNQPIGWQVNGEAVQRSRLRIEHRRWAAEKLKPKVYGVRSAVEISGSLALIDTPDDEIADKIMELVTTGRLKLPAGVQLDMGDEPEQQGEDDDADDYSDIA